MQVLLSLPGMDEIEAQGGVEQSLFRKVCGIPLLARVIATAGKSGATEVLLLHPRNLAESRLRAGLNSALGSALPVHTFALDNPFDPDNRLEWQVIESRLESKFLWLPWNAVVDRKLLSRLIAVGKTSDKGVRLAWPEGPWTPGQQGGGRSQEASPEIPAVCIKEKLGIDEASPGDRIGTSGTLSGYLANPSLGVVSTRASLGVLVRSVETARKAERELVRQSGKESDGIYSKFNRWLSRPAVRWLSKTPVTPNVVTFAGLAVAFLSAYWLAQGYWSAYVLGALLFFVSVLFDEIDGMLARVTFRESAFGCWLETFVDYASYILLFVGMTLGLHRQDGVRWLAVGGLLVFGALTSFFVLSKQRKLATDPERPQEYRARLHQRLEADKGNLVSRLVRQVEFLVRKPAFCHFVILFTALGGIKVLFLLAALGANLVWVLTLYFNRFFRPPILRAAMKGASDT